MRNKKGFTLIELLAVIVILGIVVAIAIPGINSVINTSRKNTFIQEANLFADHVTNGVTALHYEPYPQVGQGLVVPINKVNMEKGGKKSTFGGSWVNNKTYVVVYNNNNSLEYFYASSDGLNCVKLTNINSLKASDINTTCSITNVPASPTKTMDLTLPGISGTKTLTVFGN